MAYTALRLSTHARIEANVPRCRFLLTTYRHAFAALGEELERRKERAEIVVAGGAALVLLLRARESTKDVDAYIIRPEASFVHNAVEAVAARLGLPDDWLNDAPKGDFVGITTGEILYDSAAPTVHAASTAQLLAMKLAAWRDAVDRSDAVLLLSQMDGSTEEIWAAVRPLVPPRQLDKASYAFEDLWETLHGHS